MSQRSFSRAQQRKQAAAARREALRRRRTAGLAAGAAFGASALLATSAQAATFTVNSLTDASGDDCTTTCTLRDAVDLANANDEADTIIFASGLTGTIPLGSQLTLTSPDGVTITGPGAADLTLDGGGESRLLQVDHGPLTLTGLTLAHGRPATGEDGGAIRSTGGGAVTLAGDTLTGSAVDEASGGAIAVDGPLSVTSSTLSGNTAPTVAGGAGKYTGGGGAAIVVTGAGTTTIADSTVSNNSGKYGAISHKSSGQLTVSGSTMSGNTGSKYGAALVSTGPTTVTGSTISGNSSKYSGAVQVSAATTISGSTLSENATTASGSGPGGSKYGRGGAIRSSGAGTLTVTSSTLSGNSASGGGAIFADSAVRVSGSTLSDNGASSAGGAIAMPASGDLKIDASQLTANTADHGGAILAARPTTITASTLSENTAGGNGGAISSSGNLTIDGTDLHANTAGGRGGAIDQSGPLAISTSKLTGNTAGSGGALALRSGQADAASLSTTSVTGNTATGDGGGVSVDSVAASGSVTIARSTIAGNQAGSDESPRRGGGVRLGAGIDGAVRITESTVSGNRADLGAGIDAGDANGVAPLTGADGSVSVDNSTVAANTAATSGGGLRLEAQDNTASTGVVALTSTIVADNTAAGAPQDLDHAPASPPVDNTVARPDADPAITGGVQSRFSLIEAPGTVPVTQFASKPSILGVDPQLGPLADNGGPTQTQLPAGKSPVVDQGHAPAAEETDQRGSARPVNTAVPNATGGDGTDIGAVELTKDAVPVPPTPPAPDVPAPVVTTPPTPTVPTVPVAPPARQEFTATVSGASLAAGVRGTRRLVIANLPGVTCAVSSGRITGCSLTLRSTAALRVPGAARAVPKGTLLATGRTSARGTTRALLVKVKLTKAGAAVLATRPLGVPAAATINAVTNTGAVSSAAIVRLLRSTSIRIAVPEHTAALPKAVVAQIDATAKVFRNAKSVACNAYTDPGPAALTLTTAQATFACRRLRTDGLIAKTTAKGHSAGHPLAPGVSEARRAISRRIVLRFGL